MVASGLGGASVFRATGAGSQTIEKEGRELLSRALRPFILRRTKEQVATDFEDFRRFYFDHSDDAARRGAFEAFLK